MNTQFKLSLAALSAAALLGGCSTSPSTPEARSALTQESHSTLAAFESVDPSLRGLLDRSVGYAVFPNVGKAGFIGGGAYGRGEVIENGRMIGYADLAQGSIGLQIGAQTYDELVVFLTQSQLDKFVNNQFAFSANVSAVAIKPGVAAAADHSGGVAVFVRPQGGLMAEASIGGQQFTFVSRDQAEDRYTSSPDDRNRMNDNRYNTDRPRESYYYKKEEEYRK
jgi:lipid-binding SYLF domain-containing protein